MRTVTAKGKTVEEAIQNALELLGTTQDKVTTKVIDLPTAGFMGVFGSKPAKVEVSVNDDIDDVIREFLGNVFDKMNIKAETEIRFDEEENMLVVDIKSDQTGVIIGKRGQTLDSLQYLTSLVANKDKEEYVKITLDVENYREKRKRALQDLADKIAQNVQRKRGRYVLEPMNPYERRIIHSALQNYKNIITYSEGEEPNRHIVIEYKRDKV